LRADLRLRTLGGPNPKIARFGFTDLTLTNHQIQDYVLRRSRGRWAYAFSVTWEPSGGGLTFGVLIEDDGIPRMRCTPGPDVDPENLSTNMLIDQEWGELEVALGQEPSLQYTWPRPEWMPRSKWRPPLPGSEYVGKVVVTGEGATTVATVSLHFDLGKFGGYLTGGDDLMPLVSAPDREPFKPYIGLNFLDDHLQEDGRSAVAHVTEVTASDSETRVLFDGVELDDPRR